MLTRLEQEMEDYNTAIQIARDLKLGPPAGATSGNKKRGRVRKIRQGRDRRHQRQQQAAERLTAYRTLSTIEKLDRPCGTRQHTRLLAQAKAEKALHVLLAAGAPPDRVTTNRKARKEHQS